MNKKIILPILTLVLEVAATFLVASFFSIRFIEVMFFTGLVFTLIIFTFSSSGGSWTRFIDSQTSAQTGIMLKREPFYLRMNLSLITSAVYTAIGLVLFILLIAKVIPPA
jgi:hypothetical protein